MICPKCGAQNMDGVSFCGSCGAQMLSYTPITPEQPQQNANYSQQPQQQFQQQPPQYQQPQQSPSYSAGSVGNSNYDAFPPKNYQTEAIVVTIISFLCCCGSLISVILGIIAIVKANNVNTEFARGNYLAAKSNADAAKKLTIWAAIVSVVYVIIMLLVYVFIFSAAIAELGGWQEFVDSLK